MRYLTPPASAAEDDDVVSGICRDPDWSSHEKRWLDAYKAYREHGGDPWRIHPLCLGTSTEDLQYALYDSRKGGGPLGRIRRTAGLLSCPVCGSPTKGSLDHYLPRRIFPEFAIMRTNLVPACAHCNSGVKGQTYRGGAAERFIHPYYDKWADRPLWKAEVVRPLAAATFRPVPMPDLERRLATIVRFHLAHVLGAEFHQCLENRWATLPQELLARTFDVNALDPTAAMETELRVSTASTGTNSWYSAFFRGLASDPEASAHVCSLARSTQASLNPVLRPE